MRAIKILTIALVALAASRAAAAEADQMPWMPNLEAAQQVAARTNRLVLIHFWAPWCQPCMRLEREVFSRPETARALEANFVLVKLNTDEAPGTARLYGVSSLPSDVIIAPNGRLVSQFQSPPTANQYTTQLNQAAAGHRQLTRKPSQQAVAAPQAQPQSAMAQQMPPGAAVTVADSQFAANPVTGAQLPGAQAAGTQPPYAQQPLAQPGATAATMAAMPHAQAEAPFAGAQPPSGVTANPGQAIAGQPPVPGERYSEHFNQGNAPAGAPSQPSQQAVGGAPPQSPAIGVVQPAPYATSNPGQGAYNASVSYQQQSPIPQLPPGCPPLGLDGNCPVTLVEKMQWALGDKAWGAVHRGRTYLFGGQVERDKFLANPDLYSPVMSGIDPVLALDNQIVVPGKREFGVFGADRRIYLFADEASLKRFEQNPKRYAAEAIQAAR
jgi:thiol-disulfide isomerase/thioredoxin/YHS domain-containing protein